MSGDPSFVERLAAVQLAKLSQKTSVLPVSSPASWEREVESWKHMDAGGEFVFDLDEASECSLSPAPRLSFTESHAEIGGRVWDGGVYLARNLQHAVARGVLSLKGKAVLELGAGTGLVGMVAAYLGANKVICTDMKRVVPLTAGHVARNGSVRCRDGAAIIADV